MIDNIERNRHILDVVYINMRDYSGNPRWRSWKLLYFCLITSQVT